MLIQDKDNKGRSNIPGYVKILTRGSMKEDSDKGIIFVKGVYSKIILKEDFRLVPE